MTDDRAPAPAFREVQRFRQPWIWVALLLPLAAFGVAAAVEGMPTGTLLFVLGPWALVVAWFAWLRLTTEVDDEALTVRFFPLWKRRRIPFDRIRSARARTYRPIAEYGGWGIRYGWGHGWAYNVSGNRGVQLELEDGKRVLVGSQRPEELERAVADRLGRRTS